MDNQQQQQMNIEQKRTPLEIFLIAAGLGTVALGFAWGLRQVVPEWSPPPN
jgi:hypothetical protein